MGKKIWEAYRYLTWYVGEENLLVLFYPVETSDCEVSE